MSHSKFMIRGRASLNTYMKILRAVDRGRAESSSPHCWTFTSTAEVGGRVGMSTQQVTPLLHKLAADGYVTRTEQPDGIVTWHLLDPAVRLLRGEREIKVIRSSGLSRRDFAPGYIDAAQAASN
jgi:hypothetical protein